jgi:RHS repeat-associated protein
MSKLIGLVVGIGLVAGQVWADACSDAWANVQTQAAYCPGHFSSTCNGVVTPYVVKGVWYTSGRFDLMCMPVVCNGFQGIGNLLAFVNGTCPAMDPNQKPKPVCAQTHSGSIIHFENKAVGETIPLVGTGFGLNYFSYWSTNRIDDYKIKGDLSLATVISGTSGYSATLRTAQGTTVHTQAFPACSDQTYSFYWDGLDGSGNPTLGPQSWFLDFFQYFTGWNSWRWAPVKAGGLKSILLGLGGWVPDNWMFYDTANGNLIRPDGSTEGSSLYGPVSGLYRVAETDGSKMYYFDTSGRLVHVKSPMLGTTLYSYSYDGSGRIASTTDAFGRTTTFNYTSGLFSSITAPNGAVTLVTLDSNGYLASVTNPKSETYSMTYINANGLLSTFTKPNSAVSTFTYDSDGFLVSDSHSGGFSSTLGMSGANITLTSSMGRVRQEAFVYDKILGIMTQTVTEPDGSKNEFESAANYKESTFRNQSIKKNHTAHPRFSGGIKFVSQTDEKFYGGRLTAYTFSAANFAMNALDPFAYTSTTEKATIGSGGTATETTTVFTKSTKTWLETTKLGRTLTNIVDSYERLVSSQVGSQTAVVFSYANENLAQITQGARVTFFGYDPTSKLLTSITNANNETTTLAYDSAERLSSMTLPDSRVIGFTFDSVGNLTSITPPGQPAHVFTFNSKELNSGYEPPALDMINNWNTSYTYNNDKQLTQITRPDGQTISYNYGSTTGALNTITGAFGTYTQTYDSSKNPVRMTAPDGSYINHTLGYSAVLGNDYFASGGTTKYKYVQTANNRATMATDKVTDAANTARTISYTYDNDEYLILAGDISLSYDVPDGKLTATGISTLTDAYSYNAFGEVTGYQAKIAGTTYYSYSLTRDNLGRISQKIEGHNGVSNTYDYFYDSSGRLIQVDKNSVTASTYSYDSNSNRIAGTISGTSTSATYDDQDRLTAYNVNTYTYNRNGELATKTDTLLSQTTTYTYNVFGQLESVALPSQTINYELDPKQRRFGWKIGSTVQGRYARDQFGRIVAELNSSNAMTRRYVYASKSHVPDYFLDMAGEKYRIFSDNLGSVRLVVKLSTGTVMQLMEHDEFGRVLQDTNPGYQPFGFAGGEYTPATGLVRFGARDFDPEIGRWLSKDPIGFGGGDVNLFGYVFFDPINLIDPSGLRINFHDSRSERLFYEMRNNANVEARQMMDRLEADTSFIVNLSFNATVDASHRSAGFTFKDGNSANIMLSPRVFQAQSWIAQGLLLHELAHADQILNGIPPIKGALPEPRPLRMQQEFMGPSCSK